LKHPDMPDMQRVKAPRDGDPRLFSDLHYEAL
jgi:hypothetical protein